MQQNEEFIALLKSTINENGLNTIPGDDLIEICKRARSIDNSSKKLDMELSRAINTLLEEIKKRGLTYESKPQEIYTYKNSFLKQRNAGGISKWIYAIAIVAGSFLFLLIMNNVMGPSRILNIITGAVVFGVGGGIYGLFKKRFQPKDTKPQEISNNKYSSFTKKNKDDGVVSIICPKCGFERDQSLDGLVKQGVCPVCEKKYKRSTMKEIIGNHKTICMILLFSLILVMGALFFRYESEQIGSRLVRYDRFTSRLEWKSVLRESDNWRPSRFKNLQQAKAIFQRQDLESAAESAAEEIKDKVGDRNEELNHNIEDLKDSVETMKREQQHREMDRQNEQRIRDMNQAFREAERRNEELNRRNGRR